MIFHRSEPFLLLVVLALLAGCAGGKRPPASTDASGGSGGEGIYKIGTPYNIDGVWYYPATNYAYDETGIASWYGEEFHGRNTANGEIFDANTFSAAHPTLPMPSIVQVTNLENGRTLVLRVNDRGPFVAGRVIDVSRGAARALGFEGQGTTKVRVKILAPESIQAALLARRNGGDEELAIERPQAAPRVPVAAGPLPADFRLATAQQPVPPAPSLAPPARTIAALPSAGATIPARPRQNLHTGRRLRPGRQCDQGQAAARSVRSGDGGGGEGQWRRSLSRAPRPLRQPRRRRQAAAARRRRGLRRCARRRRLRYGIIVSAQSRHKPGRSPIAARVYA